MDQVPFHDDRVEGLDWAITTPAAARGDRLDRRPPLVRVGWVDGAFVAGALTRFATLPNHQTVEIGPWGHGGRVADPLLPVGPLDDSDLAGPRARTAAWWSSSRDTSRDPAPPAGSGTLTFSTLGTDRWRTVDAWPPEIRRPPAVSGPAGELADDAGPESSVRFVVDPGSSTGPTNGSLTGEIGGARPTRIDGPRETLLASPPRRSRPASTFSASRW